MKIIYTTEYSGKNICGVWSRVKEEAEYMHSRGHDITIISTDINKESISNPLDYFENIGGITYIRLNPIIRISENTSIWPFNKLKKLIKKIQPDIIICNTYRHPETNVALKVAKKLGIPCCLTTHAPFLDKRVRSTKLNAMAWLYDRLFCRLNEFSRVFAISKWEIPYLYKLGLSVNKLDYLPNALPEELASPDELFINVNNCSQKCIDNCMKKCTNEYDNRKKILFLGRVVPIKDLPTLIKAIAIAKDCTLTIAGPFDKEYRDFLVKGMILEGVSDRICFVGSIDTLKAKIDIINEHDIFILPSKREGLPKSLIEAMALGKICISSRNQGANEIIRNGENGFLFDIGDSQQLAHLINGIDIFDKLNIGILEDISKKAKETAKEFAASRIYPQTEEIYLSLVNDKSKKL